VQKKYRVLAATQYVDSVLNTAQSKKAVLIKYFKGLCGIIKVKHSSCMGCVRNNVV